MESIGNHFGDSRIKEIFIDLETKKTELLLEKWTGENNLICETYSIKFIDVKLQHFDMINDSNIIFDIEESKDFNDLKYNWEEYLNRIKNYLPSSLKNIENDKTNKYYLISTSFGLEAFVVCKAIEILEK